MKEDGDESATSSSDESGSASSRTASMDSSIGLPSHDDDSPSPSPAVLSGNASEEDSRSQPSDDSVRQAEADSPGHTPRKLNCEPILFV